MYIDGAGWTFLVVAAVCYLMVAIGLKTGKTLGIAFRSRFIARKKEEPILFGCSLWIFGVLGTFLIYVVLSLAFANVST